MSNTTIILLKYRFLAFKNLLEGIQAKKIMLLKLFHNQDDLFFINGLVFGEKNETASYLADFTNAGMLHVLVASGFNVSLVASLAWWASKNLPKKTQFITVLISIWSYTAYLEFEPPLLRAAGMFSVAFFLKYQGIKTKRARILLVSIAGILLAQPGLIDSLSLWLSTLATFGIISFSQRMFMFWNETTSGNLAENWPTSLKRLFLEEASTSFAAQSLIFPVLIWVFHSRNLVSFIANPVMLPWLGGITQAGGLEYGLTFLANWWWGRVFLGLFTRVMAGFYKLYFAAVAWWQQLFWLNQTTTVTSRYQIIMVWSAVILAFLLYTRIKQERKNHFFHEEP